MAYNLGSDPELVVRNIHGEYIPAFGVVEMPTFAIDLGEGELTPDGLAVEFTVKPTVNPGRLVERIGKNIIATIGFVQTMYEDYGSLSCNPYAPVTQQWVDMLDNSFPNKTSLQTFGCRPDESPYRTPMPVRPDPATHLFRSTGGHLHYELPEDVYDVRAAIYTVTMCLDATLGLACTMLSDSKEAQFRKSLYGSAGAMRRHDSLPILEYRVLTSQALTQDSDRCFAFVNAGSEIVQHISELYLNSADVGAFAEEVNKIFGGSAPRGTQLIAQAINFHDRATCRDLLISIRSNIGEGFMSLTNALDDLLTLDDFGSDFTVKGW